VKKLAKPGCVSLRGGITMNVWTTVASGGAQREKRKRKRSMIHYSCDLCKREIEPEHDLRYVVKMEIFAAIDPAPAETEDDRDNLLEIQDILQRMEDSEDEQIGDDVYQTLRFDLCPECRKKFLKNPLAREVKQFDFSQN
jgi:hypothetical protein